MNKRLSKLQGIIFDCDGVLIESKEANKQFYNLILQRIELPPMSKEEEDYVHSHTVQESIEYIVPQEKLAQALEEKQYISYEQVLDFIRIQEGVCNFLQAIGQKGILCAVNTNRTNTIDLILRRYQLEPFFHPVVTSDKVNHPKPHPESVEYILRIWGIDADNVAFIGDSKVDEQTATAAGVYFWAYQNQALKADLYVPDFWSLKDWLLTN